MSRRFCFVRALACAGVAFGLASTAHALDRELVRPVRDVAQARPRPPQLQSLRSRAPFAGPFAPASAPSLDGSPVEYLIITSPAMQVEFQRLATWKTAKGVPAVVRTVADVEASGVHGSDRAETIRAYIRDAYLYWGVRWVLIGGDTDIIPARYAATEFLGLKDPVTDLYYSCLDGDWNADGDGNFAEPFVSVDNPGDAADLIAEVFVGRATVSTPAEAHVFVDKTLAYEKPQVFDFQDKLLLMAEVLFPASYSPGTPISIDGASFAENLRTDLVPPGTRLQRLYETNPFYPGSQPLTIQSSVAAVDSGYGIVVHIGHGYRYTLSVGNGSLDVGEAAAFTNAPRCGLFYMLNCTAAAYDFESFAEAMLLDANGGATVVVGSSREAFPLAASDYQYAFFNRLYTLHQHRVGEVMARSREEFVDSAQQSTVDRWTQLTYTLLGDPEASIRSRPPQTLQVQGLPASIPTGGQSLDLVVDDGGGPLRDALVCLAQSGQDYRVGRTDAAGHVALRFESQQAGTATLTATADDHRFFQATIPVASPARVVTVESDGLIDDGAGSGSGNSDGRLDAGETAQLLLPLHNRGSVTITGLGATLDTVDPDVEVLQATSAYPNLASNAQAPASTPFVVRVPRGVADNRVVTLTLHLSSATQSLQVSETRRIELLVHAARPRLVGLRLDDTRAGNGDGQQQPGEEIDLYYRVENRGTGTLQEGQITLAGLEAGLEVLSGSATLAPLAPGADAETTTPLTVREADVSLPHRGRLVLSSVQDTNGQARRIDLRPPQPPSVPHFVSTDAVDAVHVEWTAPADADLLGYHIERASAPGGPFVRADQDLVRPMYFRDSGLAGSQRYYYRIVAVDSGLVVGGPGPVGSVSTNPPQVAGWPLTTNDRSSSSIGIADVNGDGQPDIVGAAQQLYAWDGHGVELVDADHNALTYGLFYGQNEAFGSVALGDLDRTPGKEVVAPTWDGTARYVVAVHGDGSVMTGWPQPLVSAPDVYRGSQVGPLIVNLDGVGAPEVLVAARDGRLYGWHADGSEIADGDANPATHGVLLDTGSPFLRSAPGVAELDATRPGSEIVIGGTNGLLYAIDAQGHALAGWPRDAAGGAPFGGYFASGVSIGDLNNDGTPEIVTLDGGGRLHALHIDGSELAGFPVSGLRASSQSLVPSPALGNVAGDSKLEIVEAGSDGKLYVFDASGTALLPGGFIDTGAPTESSPILGDVDGDAGIEIVLGNENGVLGAWNQDGSPVDGFPISLRAEVRGTPTLTDADGDGGADLALLAWDGLLHVWKLGVPWRPDRAPWPTYRGNVQRTGEYGYALSTPVTAHDLVAETTAEGAVRLAWRTAGTADGDVAWRVYRSGPFTSQPLGNLDDLGYNPVTIGEKRGTGLLEFVDSEVEPGVWYVYALGMRETGSAGAGESIVGPVTVATVPRLVSLRILGNVPNPFNPETRIRFEVPSRAAGSPVEVELTLYDAVGRRVRTLLRQRMAPGLHTVDWDGRDTIGREVASGVYVARLESDGRASTRKLTLLR